MLYRCAGNCPYSQNFGAPEVGALGLSLFSLMVNPRLSQGPIQPYPNQLPIGTVCELR